MRTNRTVITCDCGCGQQVTDMTKLVSISGIEVAQEAVSIPGDTLDFVDWSHVATKATNVATTGVL